jgi:diguanylate cyclase
MLDFQRFFLGSDRQLRLRARATLTAAGVYAFLLALQGHSVWLGLTGPAAAAWLAVFIIAGVGAFYFAIRSGFSRRFSDPALTMPQMVFAIIMIAFAYRIHAHVRGTLLMVVALVLVFGAFTLRPQRCRQLGWIAVALLASAMVSGATQDPVRFEPAIEVLNFLFAAVVLPTTGLLAGQLSGMRLAQRRQKRELQDAVQRLNEVATHDELTGLVNRRHIQNWIAHEVARGQRSGASPCLALIDLDHFKRVNDTLGHACGDEVLRIVAREARAVLREVDVLARWGGEEFLLVMPDTVTGEALRALQRLRARMALASVWSDCPEARVTFSAGVTMLRRGETLEHALRRADLKLYEAKQHGRDGFAVDDGADKAADSSLAAPTADAHA